MWPLATETAATGEYIRWVEFDVPAEALEKAMTLDIETHDAEMHIDWICLLAALGARYGGDFGQYQPTHMDALVKRLQSGESMAEIVAPLTYYAYYEEAYRAVLGGFLGEYRQQLPQADGTLQWVTRYGLKAYSPVAEGYTYDHYDDFCAERSYGYQRKHMGHDLMCAVGTPIVAVESGVVEELGWNQYGGWRIGIRSLDGKRYYYYAHLRQNRPYHPNVTKGAVIQAGDVIGYAGRTGYSTVENTNNITVNHLHWGIQLIFDESQKDGTNQIWIDLYELTKFLRRHRSSVVRVAEIKEYYRKYSFIDPTVTEYLQQEAQTWTKNASAE
ncbi:MAG: M23 family metallopeptidase [Clostridia bacterium]|nr:M23 family metallopeptidase [Clostridia bacterium]